MREMHPQSQQGNIINTQKSFSTYICQEYRPTAGKPNLKAFFARRCVSKFDIKIKSPKKNILNNIHDK